MFNDFFPTFNYNSWLKYSPVEMYYNINHKKNKNGFLNSEDYRVSIMSEWT